MNNEIIKEFTKRAKRIYKKRLMEKVTHYKWNVYNLQNKLSKHKLKLIELERRFKNYE